MPKIINNQGGDLPTFDNYFTVEHSNGRPYTEAAMQVDYLWQEGLLQIPIAAPPSTSGNSNPVACEIVRAHAPCGQFVVNWMAKREGDWPLVPDPHPGGTNMRLATMKISGQAPTLNDAGVVRIYRVWGTYVYFFVQPVYVPSVGGWMGWCVYDQVAPQLNVLSPGQFRQVI